MASLEKGHLGSCIKDKSPNHARRGGGEEGFHGHSHREAGCRPGLTTADSAGRSGAGEEITTLGSGGGGGLTGDTEEQPPCLRKITHRF